MYNLLFSLQVDRMGPGGGGAHVEGSLAAVLLAHHRDGTPDCLLDWKVGKNCRISTKTNLRQLEISLVQ